MRASSASGPWAVYQMTLKGKPTRMCVVCEQSEWERMEQAQPGSYPLIRGGIKNEAEAERLAREGPPPGEGANLVAAPASP